MRAVLLLLVAVCLPFITWAQTDVGDSINQGAVELRSFDQQKWKELTKDVLFEKPEKEKKKEEPDKSAKDWNFGSWDISGLRNLLFILAIGLLLFFVIRLLNSRFLKRDKKITPEVSLIDFEEDLGNQDLQVILEKALQNKDYKQAIRIYYLIIIQDLNLKGWIKWEKDKTNRQYVQEMAGQTSAGQFKEITNQFNFIWYGDRLVDEALFARESPKFQNFIELLRKQA